MNNQKQPTELSLHPNTCEHESQQNALRLQQMLEMTTFFSDFETLTKNFYNGLDIVVSLQVCSTLNFGDAFRLSDFQTFNDGLGRL